MHAVVDELAKTAKQGGVPIPAGGIASPLQSFRAENRTMPPSWVAISAPCISGRWCAGVTYIPMTYIPTRQGFLYLVAAMDRDTQNPLAWRLPATSRLPAKCFMQSSPL